MAITVGDILLVSFRGTIFSQRVILTQTYKVISGDSGSATEYDFSTDAANSFLPGEANDPLTLAYLDCLATDYTLNEIRVQRIYVVRDVYGAVYEALAGTGLGTCVEGISATPITLVSDAAGRSEIAVKHIGPVPTAGMSAGAPTVSQRDKLAVLGDEITADRTFPSPAGPVVCTPCIWHRAIAQSSLVVGYRISDRVGTVRRRILRLGE